MGIYVDYTGIQGEATQQDHKKWIDVLSLSWGTGRGISTVAGTEDDREVSEPSLSDVTIVKRFDAASPELVTEASAGSEGKTVKIDITTPDSPGVTYCTYTLSNALISSYAVSTSGERPTESVSISYTRMEFRFTPYHDVNKAGTPTTISYDIATTKKSQLAPHQSSDLSAAYAVPAEDAVPLLVRAGEDIYYAYDFETRTGSLESGAIDLTSRVGSLGNDVVFGTAKSEVLNGLDGNDVLRGGAANDVINGCNGIDTAAFSGLLAEHTILAGGVRSALVLPSGAYGEEALSVIEVSQFNVGPGELRTVVDQVAGRNGTDTLSQVERLQFIDAVLAFDTGQLENAGEAYRLYKTALDRTPDQQGLGYWIKQIDHGDSLESVVNAFIASTEFNQRYGSQLSDSSFVTLLYRNALGRAPDDAGMRYWLDQLSQGVSRGEVLASISESPESVSYSLPLVTNGIQYQEWTG